MVARTPAAIGNMGSANSRWMGYPCDGQDGPSYALTAPVPWDGHHAHILSPCLSWPWCPVSLQHFPTTGLALIMSDFSLTSVQWLPGTPDEVFGFYTDAFSLERITPSWLRFRVLTPPPIALSVGTEIDYWLRLHGFPLRWRSRITIWEPMDRFVDEQIHGPYLYWYHEHTFSLHAGGTLVHDRVHYAVPGGRLVNFLLVRNDLRRIFTYRQQQLAAIFGGSPHHPAVIDIGERHT